jgi:hypothetical protein
MLKHASTFDHSADDLIKLLCGEAFNVEAQGARPDVVSVDYKLLKDGDMMEFVVPYRHYKRTRTFKLDKKVIEDSRSEYKMNMRTKELVWKHVGAEEAGKIRIEGVTRFVPLGPSRTRLERDVTIEIKIPIVGRGIAKYIEGEFRKAYDEVEHHINESIGRLL